MKIGRRRFLSLAAGAATAPATTRLSWAQDYPIRPITIIVPFAAGGPNDTIARVLTEPNETKLHPLLAWQSAAGVHP